MFDNSFDILAVLTNVLNEIENLSKTLDNIEEHLSSIDRKMEEKNKWEFRDE